MFVSGGKPGYWHIFGLNTIPKILKYFGFLQNISFEMIDHASMDFNFDISEVIDKFNFNPKEFLKS